MCRYDTISPLIVSRISARAVGGIIIDCGVLHCAGHDQYRRRLCRVSVNGRDVGDIMVREKLAVIREDWR